MDKQEGTEQKTISLREQTNEEEKTHSIPTLTCLHVTTAVYVYDITASLVS